MLHTNSVISRKVFMLSTLGTTPFPANKVVFFPGTASRSKSPLGAIPHVVFDMKVVNSSRTFDPEKSILSDIAQDEIIELGRVHPDFFSQAYQIAEEIKESRTNPAVLLGHSQGCMLALLVALFLPDPIAVICIAPPTEDLSKVELARRFALESIRTGKRRWEEAESRKKRMTVGLFFNFLLALNEERKKSLVSKTEAMKLSVFRQVLGANLKKMSYASTQAASENIAKRTIYILHPKDDVIFPLTGTQLFPDNPSVVETTIPGHHSMPVWSIDPKLIDIPDLVRQANLIPKGVY
ncbi:MAG: alpha/beta hydrolase [bacterium]|nr:alpha/beta hydrolase [bacterium]